MDEQLGDAETDIDAMLQLTDVQEEPLPPPCDGTKLPSEEACVIDAKFGVFVSPLGNDANVGTPASPLKTLGRALAIAQGKRVYACASAGEYVEAVNITSGASVFGGFDCTGGTWAYLPTRRATVKSPSGVPLTIATTAAAVTVMDMEFDAPPTTTKGESSVAALVANASNV